MNERAVRRALRVDHLSQPVLGFFQIGLVVVGVFFWIMASLQAAPFDVKTYGEFALTFRAEAWALAMMGPAALTWIGLRAPVKRWMVAIGAGMQMMNFCALGYSMLFTGGQPMMGILALVIFAPLHAYILGAAVNDP